MRNILICAAVFALIAVSSASAEPLPLTCNAATAVPPLVRHEGVAELVGELVLVCTGGDPAASVVANFQLFLNTSATSNIIVPGETEALLLIDEPQPSPANNLANGFPYVGQVKGTPGVLAGLPGSGNVYAGMLASPNSLKWVGVPVVPPGAGGSMRVFRFVNIRANARLLPVIFPPPTIEAVIAVTSSIAMPIVNPQQVVGFVQPALLASMTANGNLATLNFAGQFAGTFRPQIRNIPGSPAPGSQDIPGMFYCTESGFTPEYAGLAEGMPGYANTGTRIAARLAAIPAGVLLLRVPNSVTAGGMALRRVLPPYGLALDGGTLAAETGSGFNLVLNQEAVLVYEVVPAPPYDGNSPCAALASFAVSVEALPATPLAGMTMQAAFAPLSFTGTSNQIAPEPRFRP